MMSIVSDWRERHPKTSSKTRVFFYVFLLAMVLFFMFKTDAFLKGFSKIFFEAPEEVVEER